VELSAQLSIVVVITAKNIYFSFFIKVGLSNILVK